MSVNDDKPSGYKVGAILEGSWGYDQTNREFYRITRRTNDTVWLEHLETVHVRPGHVAGVGPDPMTEHVRPGEALFGPKVRRRLVRREGEIIGCNLYPYSGGGWLSLWDGTDKYASHYA